MPSFSKRACRRQVNNFESAALLILIIIIIMVVLDCGPVAARNAASELVHTVGVRRVSGEFSEFSSCEVFEFSSFLVFCCFLLFSVVVSVCSCCLGRFLEPPSPQKLSFFVVALFRARRERPFCTRKLHHKHYQLAPQS